MFTSARLLLCFLFPISLLAQVSEDFSDGDFVSNPIWEGDTNSFVVNEAFELQSNGPDTASGVLHLSTPNTRLNATEWRLRVRYAFPPSGSNRVRVYLVSDRANLEGELNGYFLEMGETGAADPINFFRQSGTELTLLESGVAGTVGSGINVHLRVFRDELGNWEIFADPTGGENFVPQGSVFDNTHSSTAYFGWQVNHSSSRSQAFFLDDVFIGEPTVIEEPPADTLAPQLLGLSILSPNQLELLFSEPIDPLSLSPVSNFSVDPGIGSPFSADLDIQDSSRVRLNFVQGFINNVGYILSISGVNDVAGNAIADTSISFSLGSSEIAAVGEVIINEIFPDPTPSVGLPGVEYLELLNISDKEFNLQDWTLDNGTTVGTLPAYALGPGEFVVLSRTDADSIWGNNNSVIAVSPWTNLVNGGDELVLKSVEGTTIDSLFYSIAWYGDPDRDGGGYALERITTEPITCPPITNWAASNDPAGGTPGTVNSLFSTSGDTLTPTLVSVELLTQDTLLLCFSESMDLASLTNAGNYQIDAPVSISSAQALDSDAICVVLGLSDTLSRGSGYQIQVSNVSDCSGNTPPATLTGEVFLSFDPQVGDIIFHELMIDPNPSVGLPETEYIELYNASGSTYNLGGWIVSNGTRNPSLDTYILGPGEYVVLVEAGDEVLFPNLTNLLAVSPWPTLPNARGTLELKTDILSNPIDSVSYTSEWYQNGVKANGGFSLERIDAGPSSCPPFANWIAAETDSGGTPGVANSARFLSNETVPPSLESVSIISPDTLLFCFNESMDPLLLADPGNYGIDGGLSILEAQVEDLDQTCVRVALSEDLIPGTIYTVSVEEVGDCRGNILEGRVEQQLLVSRTPEPEDIIINEIFADPSPQVGLPTIEYIEVYNRSDNAYFLQGWTLSNGSTLSSFPAQILESGGYAIAVAVDDTSAYTEFGQVLPMLSWPSLVAGGDNLGIRTATGILMDTVDYDISWYRDDEKSNGGYSLERINPDTAFCIPITNWAASTDPIGGTPGQENSIFSLEEDRMGPVFEGIRMLASDTLLLCFDETLDIGVAEAIATYDISPSIPITQARILGPEFRCVKLTLGENLELGEEYVVSFSPITDCKGNMISTSSTVTVSVGDEPLPGEVIFTELMPDPISPVGQPESEYIEIYNRSENSFNVEGWTLTNGSTIATLTGAILTPGSYLLLVPEGDAPLFSDISNVLPVGSWPTLTNGGDNIGLRSTRNTLLDSLDYDISWYRDAEKDNGGYSLERIDLMDNACLPSTNWIASEDESGGTPGGVNSVIRDTTDQTPPTLLEVIVIASDSIRVCFSEPVSIASASNVSNYLVNGQALITQVTPLAPDFSCYKLSVAESLIRGIEYNLEVSGISDCYGNIMASAQGLPFSLGETAEPFEVVFTEIFADPDPQVGLPEAEYVEIHNRSAKIIDLSNWSIQDPRVLATWEEAILQPGEYAILTRSQNQELFQSFGKVIPVDRFPDLGNASDSLYLLNELGIQIDYVFYDRSWYENEVKDDGGYSLEKIDPDFTDCNNPGNWSASRAEIGGTPGTENSIKGTFQDSLAPSITGIRILDPNTVEVFFSEQMDPETLQVGDNYSISPTIGSPLLGFPASPGYNSVQLLFDADLDSSILYTLTYSNLADCGGNLIEGSINFGFPESISNGDILLNEILFNPLTGGSDYVEIKNVSEKVLDLQDLFLGEIDPDTREFTNIKPVAAQTVLILPGELLCLTSDVSFQRTTYLPPDTAKFFQMESFPSYADNEGIAVLFTQTDTLEIFEYLDDFHFPTLADDDGVSLERISLDDPIQDPGNWQSASATVNYGTPGYTNSQAVSTEEPDSQVELEETTFTPNGDGIKDVLTITYDFDFIGVNARVSIFDVNGRLVRTLQNNTLLDPGPGSFFWDGRDDDNQKALIGPYVVLFEVANQQTGEKEVFKRVAVLADNF